MNLIRRGFPRFRWKDVGRPRARVDPPSTHLLADLWSVPTFHRTSAERGLFRHGGGRSKLPPWVCSKTLAVMWISTAPEREYHTVTVDSEGTLDSAAARQRGQPSPTHPLSKGGSRILAPVYYRVRLTVGQARANLKGTHPHHSPPSPSLRGLEVVATAATVSSSAPPGLIAASRSDFASKTSPRNSFVTP